MYVHGQQLKKKKMITDPLNASWNLRSLYSTSFSPSDHYGGKRVVMSSRWNPTAEQVQALEEMYARGTRTPSAAQIQEIAAKLSKFGKIEGKNVFYWFQNHKARDRQKKRRHLSPNTDLSGLSKRSRLETEHPKKLPTLSNCSTASKWCESTVDQKLQKKYSDDVKALNFCKLLGTKNDNFRNLGAEIKENRTLELFPIKSSNNDLSSVEEESDDDGSSCRLIPNHFFEFFPTKN